MASIVTELQSHDVDFGGGRTSPERRSSSVGDDDENQSDGTISEVDPTDTPTERGAVAQTGDVEATAGGGAGRSLQGMSQYHSISQLSAAATTASTHASPLCIQHQGTSFDFSSPLFRVRNVADSVHVLRDMFHAQLSHAGRALQDDDHPREDMDDDDVDDDDEEWNDRPEISRDRMSYNGDESPRHRRSANASMSSVDDLSGDDERRGGGASEVDTKPSGDAHVGGKGNWVPSSSGSDCGSAGDSGDVIEAKRARMESIVTSMRPSLPPSSNDKSASAETGKDNANSGSLNAAGNDDDPKRRPKRKQYIPKQHEAVSAEVYSSRKHSQVESGDEPLNEVNDRLSVRPTAEKLALESELRNVSDQLTYIRRKFAHVLDGSIDPQRRTPGYLAAGKNADDDNNYSDVDGRSGKWHDHGWNVAFHDVFTKRASAEWKKLMTDGGFPFSTPQSIAATQQNDGVTAHNRNGATMQSSPLAGDTPADVERLVDMLKLEITERVELLVNDIIRNFVAKYGLASGADCSSTDTENESNFKLESREKSTDAAVCRADIATSGCNPDVEDLSPGRDLDDAVERRSALMSTLAGSFLSVPSLLLPSPIHSKISAAVEDANQAGQPPRCPSATTSDDQNAPSRGSVDHQTQLACNVSLSASDQTAFDVPSRTAHHPLYSLFAPHPYYPNASRMAAAAAAAAAVAAKGAAYHPVQPVVSSLLFSSCREPEQTEALPLVVNAPTKKKRTKVTDTRLSPRAARSILHDGGHRHHLHSGSSYHSHHHQHHQQHHARQDTSHHRLHHSGTSTRLVEDAQDRRRSSPTMRSAVTDSSSLVSPFLQPRHLSAGLPALPLLPASLPTSVAVPNPSLQHSDIMSAIFQFSQQRIHQQQMDSAQQRFAPQPPPPPASFADTFDFKHVGNDALQTSGGSDALHAVLPSARKAAENNGPDGYEPIFHEDGLTSTLTPMHLRKAKLMFFYVRYPSSAVLKVYFPDVRFNKNNTAQLIKWFSNFREFYYIQMEKYARQALAEGVKNCSDLIVTTDSELYRVLVLHYNRNNQIEVPESFRSTNQATLREFFKSIQAEKDQEQSWKKAIYKIIARLDDTVPEYFKSSNWLEQLVDA